MEQEGIWELKGGRGGAGFLESGRISECREELCVCTRHQQPSSHGEEEGWLKEGGEGEKVGKEGG